MLSWPAAKTQDCYCVLTVTACYLRNITATLILAFYLESVTAALLLALVPQSVITALLLVLMLQSVTAARMCMGPPSKSRL